MLSCFYVELTTPETKISPGIVKVCPSSEVLVPEMEEQLLEHVQAYLMAFTKRTKFRLVV